MLSESQLFDVANEALLDHESCCFQAALLFAASVQTVWLTTNWKILPRDGNTRPPDLPPEKSVRRSRSNSENKTWNKDWFQIGKGVRQGCILSSCLFNFYAEYIMGNARLDEAQAGIKIAERNISDVHNISDMQMAPPL